MSEAATLDAVVAVSVVAALVLCLRVAAEPVVSGPMVRRCLGHPAVSLAVVTCPIYVNQVLFTVYMLRVRHGDPSFIARYLPSGWFTLERGGVVAALARHFPAPGLLAPTVLRVQAFLELPFVMFGYLTACRWLGVSDRARRFGVVGLDRVDGDVLPDRVVAAEPFTVEDLVIRVAARIIVPLWAARLPPTGADKPAGVERTAGEECPGDAVGLLVSAMSVAALGGLVLVVYDTALLYNLGKLGAELPVAVLAGVVLVVARVVASRLPACSPGRGVDSIASSFGWFLMLFFIPALPVRYRIDFGTRAVAVLAGVVVLIVACARGARDAFARSPGRLAVAGSANGRDARRAGGRGPGRACVAWLSGNQAALGRGGVLHGSGRSLRAH